jgi:hypothetical protein
MHEAGSLPPPAPARAPCRAYVRATVAGRWRAHAGVLLLVVLGAVWLARCLRRQIHVNSPNRHPRDLPSANKATPSVTGSGSGAPGSHRSYVSRSTSATASAQRAASEAAVPSKPLHASPLAQRPVSWCALPRPYHRPSTYCGKKSEAVHIRRSVPRGPVWVGSRTHQLFWGPWSISIAQRIQGWFVAVGCGP